jgi:hypothetical protein
MSGAIPPLLQYAFMAWCLVKVQGQLNFSFKGKGKVVPVLFLTEHHTMKAYWGSGGIAARILISALDGGEWSASRPSRFIPRERGVVPIGEEAGWATEPVFRTGTTLLLPFYKQTNPLPCLLILPNSKSISFTFTFQRSKLLPSSGWKAGILPQHYTASQLKRLRLGLRILCLNTRFKEYRVNWLHERSGQNTLRDTVLLSNRKNSRPCSQKMEELSYNNNETYLYTADRDKDELPFLSLCYNKIFTYLLTYSLTHWLTHSKVQDIIWKADCHSACQKYPVFFTKPEGSLPCSQKPATGPYPEPTESSASHGSPSPWRASTYAQVFPVVSYLRDNTVFTSIYIKCNLLWLTF